MHKPIKEMIVVWTKKGGKESISRFPPLDVGSVWWLPSNGVFFSLALRNGGRASLSEENLAGSTKGRSKKSDEPVQSKASPFCPSIHLQSLGPNALLKDHGWVSRIPMEGL